MLFKRRALTAPRSLAACCSTPQDTPPRIARPPGYCHGVTSQLPLSRRKTLLVCSRHTATPEATTSMTQRSETEAGGWTHILVPPGCPGCLMLPSRSRHAHNTEAQKSSAAGGQRVRTNLSRCLQTGAEAIGAASPPLRAETMSSGGKARNHRDGAGDSVRRLSYAVFCSLF